MGGPRELGWKLSVSLADDPVEVLVTVRAQFVPEEHVAADGELGAIDSALRLITSLKASILLLIQFWSTR